MVVVGTGGIGEAILRRDYPVTEGLTAGTTKQEGTVENLVPEEESHILSRNRKGI